MLSKIHTHKNKKKEKRKSLEKIYFGQNVKKKGKKILVSRKHTQTHAQKGMKSSLAIFLSLFTLSPLSQHNVNIIFTHIAAA